MCIRDRPCSCPQLLHPCSLAAVSLSSRSGDSLPRHARNPHARHRTHATPTHALCTTASPPPSPLSAPTHTPPPSWKLSPSVQRHPTYPPLYPLLKQTIKRTNTHSKPKTKTKTTSLEPVCWTSTDSLTSVLSPPLLALALSTPFSSPFPSVQARPTSPSQLPWPIPTLTPLGSFPDILPLPCAKGSSSSTLFPLHNNQPKTKNQQQKPPPPQQPPKPTLNLSPRMPLTTSPQGPRLSVSLSIPSGLPSPAPTQPPRTLGGQGVPARLHAPRTRTGPTLPRTSPPLFQGIPSTLFLPLKTNPNFNLSVGAPLPSSPPSPTLAVALPIPSELPSPPRS